MFLHVMKIISTSFLVVFLLHFSYYRKSNLVNAFFMEGVRFQVRTLTSDSFEPDVIESNDAWILAIKGSTVSENEWQTEENKLRGVVKVAFVDLITDGEFMFKKGIIKKNESSPVAVVFPYGGVKTKKNKHKEVYSVKEAKRLALSSLSEDYVSWVETRLQVQAFVENSYTSWPPRFPVVLTTERKITPPLYRAISIKYSKYFNFGVVHSLMAHAVLGLVEGAKIPRLDVLISSINPNNTKSITMNSLSYNEAYGPVKYPYLIRFLFSAHEKYWPELPGSKRYSEKLDLEDFYKQDLKAIFSNPESDENKTGKEAIKLLSIKEIAYDNHKRMCDDLTQGYCVIAFLNGSKKVFEKNFPVFSEVHKIEHFQDKPLNFMWINASCHPEYGITFGISPESLPALLVAKPQRRFFVMHTGKFNKNAIAEFIDKISMGRFSFSPYSRFEDLEKRSCGRPKLNNFKVVSDVMKEETKEATDKEMKNKGVKNKGLHDREEL